MKLQHLNIKKFRHMYDLNFEFGDVFTVISGLNGCGKTTFLGLASHPFGMKGYSSKFNEVFQFCPENEKDSNDYEYSISVLDANQEIITKNCTSRSTTEKGKPRFRIDVGTRTKDKGKIIHPVIYLGLKRFVPLANLPSSSIKISCTKGFSQNDGLEYSKFIKNIFSITDGSNIETENIKTTQKNFIGMKTKDYSAFGISAGQDNIGQIMSSLLSFSNLKKKLASMYSGGILIIDEIDGTLFPSAQVNLIKELYKYAKKLELQIIFTTHSLDIISEVLNNYKDASQVYFLETMAGKVEQHKNPNIKLIENKVNRLIDKDTTKKLVINVLVEDEMAKLFLEKLLIKNKTLKQSFSFKIHLTSGDGLIKKIAELHKVFRNFIFVVDGDIKIKAKNIVSLPGKKAPESVLYNFLYKLEEDDAFWKNDKTNFTKAVCFNGFIDLKTEKDHKKWLKHLKKHFRDSKSYTFNTFIRDLVYGFCEKNPDAYSIFIKSFTEACNKIL